MKAVDGVDPAHEGKEAVMADSADDAANGYANPTGQFTLFPLAPIWPDGSPPMAGRL